MPSDSKNSTLRPPRPSPRTVTVVSPPDSSTQGVANGWPRRAACWAMPAITLPTSRASPSRLSPRIYGVTPAARATPAAASSAICGVAISSMLALARRGSPGLTDSPRPLSSSLAYAGRQGDAVAAHDIERVAAGGGVGHRRAGGDIARLVARHVGNRQGQHPRRMAGGGQPAALDGGQVAPHAIHLADGGAGSEQGAVQVLFVGQADAGQWQRQQRRAAAGNQAQHGVVCGQICRPAPACAARPACRPRPAPDALLRRSRCVRRARHSHSA